MAMTITVPTFGAGRRVWNCRSEYHGGNTSAPRLLFPACGMDHKYTLPSFQLFGAIRKLNVVPAINQEVSKRNIHNLESYPCAWIFLSGFSSISSFADIAYAIEETTPNAVYEVGELLEFGVQLIYLGVLLGVLGVGSFFVVRQILIRRELENAAKELQERVRSGEASAMEYFELGAVMLRKKFYPLAAKYLEQAIQKWEGDIQDLAQVHNALGFSYVSDGKINKAASEFEKAVKLQPGYVTAWNNIGDVYEKKKDLDAALKAYEQALLFDPHNKIARARRDAVRERLDLFKGIPSKSKR